MRANPRGSRGNVCERPEDMAWHVHETGRPRFTCHVKRSTRQIPIFTTCARNLYPFRLRGAYFWIVIQKLCTPPLKKIVAAPR